MCKQSECHSKSKLTCTADGGGSIVSSNIGMGEGMVASVSALASTSAAH